MSIRHCARRLIVAAVSALGTAAFAGPVTAQQVQVTLGDTVSVETLSFVIALERAKERGFDYKLTSFAKEDLAIQAVISGQAQVGAATPYAVMQKTKAPVRALFQMTHLVFFPVTDVAIKSWKDLDGQPFTFHARGSGTEAIGNILAKRNGITFGQRNYIAGSENRVVAMINGQIKATILDLPNKNLLMERAPGRFHTLPGVSAAASDEVLFVRTDWLDKNRDKAEVLVAELLKVWTEMHKNPAMIEEERVKRGLLKDLPKEVLANVTKYYTDGTKEGVFSKTGGSAETIKADFEFYTEAGQMSGPADSLKVEDFWDFEPLAKAREKAGT